MYSLSSHHTFANTSIVLYLIYLGQDSLCQYGILIQYYYTSYHLLTCQAHRALFRCSSKLLVSSYPWTWSCQDRKNRSQKGVTNIKAFSYFTFSCTRPDIVPRKALLLDSLVVLRAFFRESLSAFSFSNPSIYLYPILVSIQTLEDMLIKNKSTQIKHNSKGTYQVNLDDD